MKHGDGRLLPVLVHATQLGRIPAARLITEGRQVHLAIVLRQVHGAEADVHVQARGHERAIGRAVLEAVFVIVGANEHLGIALQKPKPHVKAAMVEKRALSWKGLGGKRKFNLESCDIMV